MSLPLSTPLPAEERIDCLKPAGSKSVWLVRTEAGRLCTLKTWPLTFSLRWRQLLGLAQYQRQIRGTERLQRIQVATPAIHAVRTSQTGFLELLIEYVEGTTLLHLKFTDEVRPWEIARALGRVLAQLVGNGLVHGDLKMENLVIAGSPDKPEIWLIDTVDVWYCRNKVRALCRMLERLSVHIPCLGPSLHPHWVVALLKQALRPFTPARRRQTLNALRRLKQGKGRQ